MQRLDLVGQRFGRLTVQSFSHSKQGNAYWTCICDCGKPAKQIAGHTLKRGDSKSCGCLNSELTTARNFRHGNAKKGNQSRAYETWSSMISRCTNPNNKRFISHGGRGIRICERWRVFENFLADMGDPPEGMSLDRINNAGNYEPGNCRWATDAQQVRNRRVTRMVRFAGRSRPLAEWCEELGLRYDTILYRLKSGWPVDDAFSTPIGSVRNYLSRPAASIAPGRSEL